MEIIVIINCTKTKKIRNIFFINFNSKIESESRFSASTEGLKFLF